MYSKVSAVTLFAGLAAAYHTPTTLGGNPITAPLNNIVPACKPYEIQWEPSSSNPVTILLLRGPSTNVVPLGAPIADGIANSGSFSWTPASTLEADTTHYGIQLIDDVTGEYQYSTQFGISTDDCAKVSSASSSAKGYPTSTPVKSYAASSSVAASSSSCNSTSVAATSTKGYPTSVGTSVYVASTGYPAHNSSVIQPTKPLTVPASLQTSTYATATAPGSSASASLPVHTGAASNVRAGLALAGGIAGLVFML